MAKDKKKVDVKGDVLALLKTKDGFLNLCQQYQHMGQLLGLLAKVLTHPMFSKTSAPAALQRILEQYQHMGEQLKEIGTDLDSIGGKPVLQPAEEKPKKETKKKSKKSSSARKKAVKEAIDAGRRDEEEEGEEN